LTAEYPVWRLVLAGKVALRDVHDPEALDWETVEKLNALMDMEDDYQTAWREFMQPENKG
jgi:hypothetical protein